VSKKNYFLQNYKKIENYFCDMKDACFLGKMKNPIIIYQMGKVGSSSIKNSLKSHGIDSVFHAHRINPDNIKAVQKDNLEHGLKLMLNSIMYDIVGNRIYFKIVERNKKSKFITLTREPISRNISAFFQNFLRFTDKRYTDSDFTINELINLFLKEYNHNVPLTWFDVEIKETLGIDVYQHPFPKEKGYLKIKKNNFDLLIIKCELDDKIKNNVLSSFLNLKNLKLTRSNVSLKKEYSATYLQLSSLKLT